MLRGSTPGQAGRSRGRPEFLARLGTTVGGPAAISRLLSEAEHILPRVGITERVLDIEQGAAL
ncbi:hypothetical protein ACFXHD_00370 [Streptomyces hydrogenans]|uniref:hypothetical protein n=1 Tax=Streptomyces hydrogenans TaxID=1873719 RepID=UPI00367CDC15